MTIASSNGSHTSVTTWNCWAGKSVAVPRKPKKALSKQGFAGLLTRFELRPRARGSDRRSHIGHADFVAATASTAPIPEARFDDLDREGDGVEWHRRLAELAAARLASARARFERLGIVDADGKLVSRELPRGTQHELRVPIVDGVVGRKSGPPRPLLKRRWR